MIADVRTQPFLTIMGEDLRYEATRNKATREPCQGNLIKWMEISRKIIKGYERKKVIPMRFEEKQKCYSCEMARELINMTDN